MNRQIDVPIINMSALYAENLDAKMRIAAEIDAACRDSGFFYAANHGIDLRALEEVVTEFHRTMTDSEKWDLAIHTYNPNNRRSRNGYYMAMKGKKAPESYCYLNPSFTQHHPMIVNGTPLHEVNVWPSDVLHPGFRAFCEEYYWSMFRVASALLTAFALALGKDQYFFEPYFTTVDTLSSVSLIRYPYLEDYPLVKTATDGTKLSFGHHTDVSLLTILYQTPVPNLQVATSSGYRDLPTSSDCFLVNCGTYMTHMTNNYYQAPGHRVKFVNAERLSIPFFVNLGYNSAIKAFKVNHIQGDGENEALPYGEYLKNGLHNLIVTNGQT